MRNHTYLLTCSAVLGLLTLFAVTAPVARADAGGTILFQDLTDQVSISSDTSRATFVCGVPGPEDCTLTLSAPSGAFFSGTTLPAVYNIGEADFSGLSDTIITSGTSGTNITSITIQFNSDTSENQGGVLGFCIAEPSSCPSFQAIENGLVQTAGTVNWFMPEGAGFCIAEPQLCANGIPGTTITDTIQFESDVNESTTPEPGTLVLLGTGVLSLAGSMRKKFLPSRKADR
jgi:hypothetical protein